MFKRLLRKRVLLVLSASLAVGMLVAVGVVLAADPVTYTDGTESVTFPQGTDSFVDTVDAYPLTDTGVTAATYGISSRATGVPDAPTGAVTGAASTSLGDGGSIILRFADNALTGSTSSGSGNTRPDLYVFEAGTYT